MLQLASGAREDRSGSFDAVGGVGASGSGSDGTCGIAVMGPGAGGVAGAGDCVESEGAGAVREEGGVASTGTGFRVEMYKSLIGSVDGTRIGVIHGIFAWCQVTSREYTTSPYSSHTRDFIPKLRKYHTQARGSIFRLRGVQ